MVLPDVIKFDRLKAAELVTSKQKVVYYSLTLSSRSHSSGFIKILACFQNEITSSQYLLGRRDGSLLHSETKLGWRCLTQSLFTQHSRVVKSLHPERRFSLRTKSLVPMLHSRWCYITFSKSCKDLIILSSWKQWEKHTLKSGIEKLCS